MTGDDWHLIEPQVAAALDTLVYQLTDPHHRLAVIERARRQLAGGHYQSGYDPRTLDAQQAEHGVASALAHALVIRATRTAAPKDGRSPRTD